MNTKKTFKTNILFFALAVFSLIVVSFVATNFFKKDSQTAQAAQNCSNSGYLSGNLTTCTSSYLGGSGNDEGNAVEIQSSKNIVIGGKFSSTPAAANNYSFLNGTTGAILITDSTGKELLSVTKLGSIVDDMDINRTDNTVYAVGDFGLVALSANGSSVLWSKTNFPNSNAGGGAVYSNGRRVAVALDGTVMVVFNKQAYIYDKNGNQLGTTIALDTKNYLGGDMTRYVEDIAIDSQNKQFIVAGWSQVNNDFQSAALPFISYDTASFGTLKWQNYAWWASASINSSSTADTRSKRVSLGRDNKLYFTGKSDGGNTIFRYNPQCLVLTSACRTNQTTTSTNTASIDTWNNGAGAGVGDYGYFARFNLQNGNQEVGQFQYTNAGVNAARSYSILPITADESGNVYQGGKAVNGTIPYRNTLKINNNPTTTRIDNETALIGVNSNFTQRTVTATWTGSSSPNTGEIRAISAANGIVAVLGNINGNIVTSSTPLQGTFGGSTDAFFAVWGDSTSGSSSSSISSSNSSQNSSTNSSSSSSNSVQSSSTLSSQTSSQSMSFLPKPKPIVSWGNTQNSSSSITQIPTQPSTNNLDNNIQKPSNLENSGNLTNSSSSQTNPNLSIYNSSQIFNGAFGVVEITASY